MPGEKRKPEQETWLSPQLKKSKEEQVKFSDVYYSTLVKLRSGTKAYYDKLPYTPGLQNSEELQNTLGLAVPGTITAPCITCSSRGLRNPGACSFCDKPVCHQYECGRCKSSFCDACGFQHYEEDHNPFADNFICITCLYNA